MCSIDPAHEAFLGIVKFHRICSWLRHINGHKDGDCIISVGFLVITVQGEMCMNLASAFVSFHFIPKSSPRTSTKS